MSNFLDNTYSDLNNLVSINADEIRVSNLYVDGILILPSSTNFNNINCQSLTCQTDLSSNTLYATVSIQGVPVARFAYLDATSSIQTQFNNITTNYVTNSSLTSTLSNYTTLATNQTISGQKTFSSLIKNTSSYYFAADGTSSIYCTPNANPATTGNTTYMRQYSTNSNCYYEYGNGDLIFRTVNAATGATTGNSIIFGGNGWLTCGPLQPASIFNFNYIDFRFITSPSTNFLINNNTIPLLAIIGLQTALDAKLAITTAASTYLTISNAASTYATITSLNNYLTIASASSTYLTINNAASTYATITSLNNYLTIASASSTYLSKVDASNNYLSILDASNNYVKNTALASYVTLSTTQTISGQKTHSNAVRITNNLFFPSNGSASLYITPGAALPVAGNPTYFRISALLGNSYIDYGNGDLVFRPANASDGSVGTSAVTFQNSGSIVCTAVYTGALASFSYIDFRLITDPSNNMLFNNNMIKKSVIIDLTSDLSTINSNISAGATRITDLETRATADEVIIAANSVAITGLTATTVTHTSQIAALTTAGTVLQGEVDAIQTDVSTLQAKTQYQNVLSNFTQFSGSGLKIMSGVTANVIINSNGSSSWYNEMNIYNNLNVLGTSANGSISTSNISASTITANTTLTCGGGLTVTGQSTFNSNANFTAGIVSTNLVSNSINYKDPIVNIGNTANIFTSGGSALSFNTINYGNLTTNHNFYGISNFVGLTNFSSMNVSGFFNQL